MRSEIIEPNRGKLTPKAYLPAMIMPPYQSFVEAQRLRNPCLADLCSFLSDRNSNDKPCRIASLEFFAGSDHPIQEFMDNSLLQSKLYYDSKHEESAYITESQPVGRILIVEDISREVIEILGSCLDIDPLFFASHMQKPWIELESQNPDLSTLPSRLKLNDRINIHYHRTVVFDQVPPPGKKLLRDSNGERKVIVLQQMGTTRVGLVQHCASILRVVRDGHWIGILCPSNSILSQEPHVVH